MGKRGTLATLSILSAAVLTVAGCKNWGDPLPYDPKLLQQNERLDAGTRTARPMRPLPTTLESPLLNQADQGKTPAPRTPPAVGRPLSADEVVRLTLQEVIHRAVANNLDVRVAGYGPAIEGTRVVENQAHFDPVFFTNLQGQRSNQQTAGQIFNLFNQPLGQPQTITTDVVRTDQYTLQTGLRQNLENGGQIELRFQAQRNHSNPQTFQIDPYYQNDVVLQLTQPLLRNFGNEVNRARIDIARNTQKISLLDFRKQLEETVADLEQRYWQLVQAAREIKIQEDLLAETESTGRLLSNRLGQDVTRLQLAQANASTETRRAVLVRARARVRDLSDQIKALMNDPDMPVSGPTVVLPADDALIDPVHFDEQDQINTALENRFELAQQHYKIDNASITVGAAKNNMLPKLDLQGQYGFEGVGSGEDRAMDQTYQANHATYALGFQFEVPLGNREARAIWRRTLLQRQQAVDQYRSLINTISSDVTQAIREVNTTWEEMIDNRRAVFAEQDALRAIQQRSEGLEPLTPPFVQLRLDTQERLAQAQRDQAAAESNYNIAISRLERSKGTLLRYNNIMLEEEPFRRQLARP
jgi:outer membrane protein TolC